MYCYNFEINNYPSFLFFLFLTPEFHKNPIKFRYIDCNSRVIGESFNVKFQELFKRIYGFLNFKFKNI